MLTAAAHGTRSGRTLRPAAASSLAPGWLHDPPAAAEVAAVSGQAIYLRLDQDVLPLLAPQALRLPGAVVVPSRADLDALAVRAGEEVVVGSGQVLTSTGGLVVRRAWRPQQVPSSELPAPARRRALAALQGLAGLADLDEDGLTGGASGCGALVTGEPDRLAGLAAQAVAQAAAGRVDGLGAAVRGLVGLGPGLTPAGDDVLCGLLLGLRATGRAGARAALQGMVDPLLGRTTALSATLLRHAARGYAVPPLVALLHAWHRGAGIAALTVAGQQVAAVGHTSGRALLAGLAAALAGPMPEPGGTAYPASTEHPRAGRPLGGRRRERSARD